MPTPTVLACDWGTTNLRAWILDAGGQVLESRDFPLGVSRLAPGEAAARFISEVRPTLQAEGLPAILCGMIGSNLGWRSVPYVGCPTSPDDLARALGAPTDQGGDWVRIVPGVRSEGLGGAGDVMRGEETQLFGWLSLNPERAHGRHVVVHPGTHAKWMVLEDGRLTHFVTAMTGELFAVLREHSVLKCDARADDPAAFAEGLAAAGAGDALAARLFTEAGRGGTSAAGGAWIPASAMPPRPGILRIGRGPALAQRPGLRASASR